jgi:ABC-type protease/lipase transport system fused ATPase/permease subunit
MLVGCQMLSGGPNILIFDVHWTILYIAVIISLMVMQ